MTAPEPASTREPEKKSATITIRRSTAIIAGSIAAALIVGSIGVTVWALGSLQGAADSEAASPAATPTLVPTTAAPAKEIPSPTPEAPKPGLGTPITVGPVTFAVNSFEVVQQIDVVQGDPLVPDAGGELVMFHTTYSNSQNTADLSCGGTDLYIQVFDEQGREMAQVFETYRIPGNPECNDQLLQGTTAEWNWAVQGVAGATPTTMVVTETLKWSSPVEITLQ